jgi:parvulin-like peptidyl-prolyl isomerase
MKCELSAILVLLAASVVSAQVASHTPTDMRKALRANAAGSTPVVPLAATPVARVNGAVLTERDLQREIYTIFPYASIHNGVPKSMEREMRKGAMDMIVFEELVYQEALRRRMTISPARMQRAETVFRNQFPTQREFDAVLQTQMNGSRQKLREKIKRSLLIEKLLKLEVADRSHVTVAEARAYYRKHPEKFKHPETFSLQTISIIPPRTGGVEVQKEASKRAQDAERWAKATKTYQEFGLLAEKTSDDDWRVNMGDRKAVDRTQLPPEVVKAALAMKPGEVSGLIRLGNNYTLFRLNAHTPAGKAGFEQVQKQLMATLQKEKYGRLRAELNQRLKKAARIEILDTASS